MKHFCSYCECHGDEDLFFYTDGEDWCRICKHNNSPTCTHRKINDDAEIARKLESLEEMLLVNARKNTGNDSLTLVDILPDGPVECVIGYDNDGVPISEKINLRDTIDANGNRSHQSKYDYLRHVVHLEESDEVLKYSILKHKPGTI